MTEREGMGKKKQESPKPRAERKVSLKKNETPSEHLRNTTQGEPDGRNRKRRKKKKAGVG